MHGLFNKQQSFPTLPFITSLFSKGPLATKDVVTVCCRKVVTSSKCAFHHGKGVIFKLQGGRSYGYGHNIHSSRNVRLPANSKCYKTSSWMKKPKSGKSSGSSCTVMKRSKGKIIFKVTRQPLPKHILLEEHTHKPSPIFRDSIYEVFDTKLARARKSKHGLNSSMLTDARPPVEKLSLPLFKDTSIIDVGRGKPANNSSFTVRKSRSTEVQKVVKPNQDFVKSIGTNQDSFSSNLQSGKNVDSLSKPSHVRDSMSVCDVPANVKKVSKVKKDASSVSATQLRPPKARSKPLVFSSSEMLFSNVGCLDDVGVCKMKKLENSGKERELRKPNRSQVNDQTHGDVLQMENLSIKPLEENSDSTMKLFMGKGNNDGATKGTRLTDTVKNIMQLGNDVGTLQLECVGEKCVLRASKVDKRIGDNITPRTTHKNTEVGTEQKSSIAESDGVSRSLIGNIASGDKPFPLSNQIPMESPPIKMPPKVQIYKSCDNVTLHRHVDIKRPTKEKKVEFDTTVIEQEGKKITKLKPKHSSNLRRKSSNRSLATKRSKVYLDDAVRNPETPSRKSYSSSKIKSSALATKPKDSVLDRQVISEDSEKITVVEIDPFIPKMNLQSMSTKKLDKVIIPEDGRVIKEGECNWCPKEKKKGQNTNAGKRRLSDGLVIPQDGNTIPVEAETDSFISRSSSISTKKNEVGKSTTYNVENGMMERDGTKPAGDNCSFLSDSLGINQHVFVPSNLHSQGPIKSSHQTSLRLQLKKETETAKGSPLTESKGVTEPDMAPPSTNQIGVNRTFQTVVKNKVVESVLKEPTWLNQVTNVMSGDQIVKFPGKENTSWRSWLPPYSTNKSHNLEKVDNNKEALHPSFANNFTTVNLGTGTSSLSDGLLSRNVTKIKFNPQTNVAPTPTQNSSISIPVPSQGMKQSTEPRTNVPSDSATVVVLKSRIAQSLPEAVRLTTSQARSTLNGYSKANSGIMDNSVVGNSQLGLSNVRGTNPPANSSLIDVGTQPTGQLSVSSKVDNSSTGTGISNLSTGSACNMPKAKFPPSCNNPQPLCGGNQVGCSTNSCNTKSVFPPPCPTRCEIPNAILQPTQLSGGGNQASCSREGCNTRNVFPPPCPPQCEPPNAIIQPEQINCSSCPTCKPAFPPPCPSNNPCPSPIERAENTCCDPCNPMTKSRTHTVIDIDNLPRRPPPICIDCVPKAKPCFPPKCTEQCENPPNSCCQPQKPQDGTTKNKASLARWRAYMNYSYWSMKCLLTGVFENFLTLLRARIMHVYQSKMSKKSVPPPKECRVMQSAVVLPKKPVALSMSGFNKNHKHVNFMLQQKAKPKSSNKVKKKVRVVRSVKKSVLDDKSKRAILEEERKRKSTSAKATPALAYSEVLNIVFSQKKPA